MLQIQLFRQDKERIIRGLKRKNFNEIGRVDQIIQLDDQKRSIQQRSEETSAAMNAASKSIGRLIAEGQTEAATAAKEEVARLKTEGRQLSQQLAELEAELHRVLLTLPNLPHCSVPEGKTPEDNEVVRQAEALPMLPETALPHWELAVKYNLINFELGNKITGSGFPVYLNQGARLQRALISYFLDFNTRAGYREYYPPHMVNEASAYGTGQLPDKEGQMYTIPEDGFFMIPTAEVPLTNLFRNDIVPAAALPVKMTAYTPCFRREAGSYGKEVRGLNRVHQFDKVELVQITRPEDSYRALDEMVTHVEQLLQSLSLPYRILRLCGGDMSFTSALTYDFEVYSAAQKRWLEVSSVSNFESFQTNRMKIRYKNDRGKTELLHSLNGSSLALPRIVACLLENNQQPDGIQLPRALEPYMELLIK